MDYEAVVSKLFERHRSVQSAGFSGDAYKPGLEAMADYAASLGDPQRRFRSIHVAGTNGKGSVCSMLAAALTASGLRTGLYTSPHLLDFRERIKIISPPGATAPPGGGDGTPSGRCARFFPPTDCTQSVSEPAPTGLSQSAGPSRSRVTGDYGVPAPAASPAASAPGRFSCNMIPKEAVSGFLEKYDREGLTFFEVTTGMAFWWFAQQNVDVAVIETGLGGRLDSTNIITPELSVITSIGLDHCDLLGSTRAEIAAEKAGIFKPGVPALVWGRDPETQPVFERLAATAASPLYFAGDFPLPELQAATADSLALRLDLSGPCQDINLRTVLAALDILFGPSLRAEQFSDNQLVIKNRLGYFAQSVFGKSLSGNDLWRTLLGGIANAAAITGFRGRWEILSRDPLVICDIGHNPPALAANFSRLSALSGGACADSGGVGGSAPRPLGVQGDSSQVRTLGGRNLGGSAPRPLGVQGDSRRRRPILVVYGAMRDKDVDAISSLLPADAEYFLVQPQTPRAMPLDELALKLKHLHHSCSGMVAQGVHDALDRARQIPGAIVYIGGSTYVVSEALKCFDP